MKLYDWKYAPNPKRVRMFLAEKGLEIEREEVGNEEKTGLKPEYLARFEHRRVPLLELDDGTAIGEAMAICRYLEAEHPEPPLMGRNPREAALVEMWERNAEAEALTGLAEILRNTSPAFAGRSLAGHAAPVEQVPALAARGRQRALAYFDRVEKQLARHEFIAGDAFSVADITTYCCTSFARALKIDVTEGRPNVKRWMEAVAARPSAKA